MSGDVMTFPNTWEEYEEQYGFNDTEQVYTNGSRLIQSFRVKQWLEHIEVSEEKGELEDILKASLMLADLPPIEVSTTEQSSMVGEWTNAGVLTVCCSNCKSQFHELEAMNYCPNCGAKMKG